MLEFAIPAHIVEKKRDTSSRQGSPPREIPSLRRGGQKLIRFSEDMKDLIVALVATLAIQALTSVSVYTAAILAPIAHHDIGVTANAIGLFTSIIYGVAAVSAPIGGALVARVGAVRVSQACLLFTGGGLAVCGLAHPLIVIA